MTTSVTVSGSGFADYGEGQLVCRLWLEDAGIPSGSDVGMLLPARLLDSQRILCSLPAVANASAPVAAALLSDPGLVDPGGGRAPPPPPDVDQ